MKRYVVFVLIGLLGLSTSFLSGCSTSPSLQFEDQLRWENQAISSYRHGDLLGAESALRQLLKVNEADAQSWFLLGNVHLREQRIEAAKNAYQKALKYQPDMREARHNLAVTHLRLATLTLIEGQQYGSDDNLEFINTLLNLQGQNRVSL